MAQLEARQRLQYLHSRGITSASELHRISGVPLRTVYNVLHRIESGVAMEHHQVAGRPSLLSTNDKRRIAQLALTHPLLSASEIRDIAVQSGTAAVSVRTVQRQLKASGIVKMVPKNALPLTPQQKKQRLLFCQEHLHDDWSTTFFTDESPFSFHRNKSQRWSSHGVRRKVPHPKFPKTIMIWGGISMMGPSTLAIIRGSVNQYTYQQVLHDHLLPAASVYYGDHSWRLQQDNATPHTAASTREWLHQNVPIVLSWPPNSADLSPIENIWAVMKPKVEKATVENFSEFADVVEKIWNELDPFMMRNFINTMPLRMQACVDLHGDEIDLNLL